LAERGFSEYATSEHPKNHASQGAFSYRAAPSNMPWSVSGLCVVSVAEGSPIVVSSDLAYFLEWSPLILACLSKSEVNIGVHFHLIGAEEADVPPIPDHLKHRVGLSFERDPGLGRAYYASARFLVAPALLDIYSRPIILADIDIAFRPNVAEIFSILEGVVCAFMIKGVDNHFPWRSIPAGLVYFSGADEVREMLYAVACYLGDIFHDGAEGKNLWWCDQNALAYGLRVSNIKPKAESFFHIRRKLANFPFRFAPNHRLKKKKFLDDELREAVND
jgi:hypothetical protein